MARVKNLVPDMTDSEILRMAARAVLLQGIVTPPYRAAVAARLRAIARRVPLSTDRKEISR